MMNVFKSLGEQRQEQETCTNLKRPLNDMFCKFGARNKWAIQMDIFIFPLLFGFVVAGGSFEIRTLFRF